MMSRAKQNYIVGIMIVSVNEIRKKVLILRYCGSAHGTAKAAPYPDFALYGFRNIAA